MRKRSALLALVSLLFVGETGSAQSPGTIVTDHIVTVAGGGTLVGDGGPATAALLNGPEAVAVDSFGNLYIAQISASRVRKIDAMTGTITTVAGTGVAGYAGDGGPAASALLNTPRGVAFDASGNLYIGDSANNRIRKVDAITGIITTFAGGGAPADSLGDGLLAAAAQLSIPFGAVFDSSGNMYIADSANNRVRKVDAITGVITTFAGGGAPLAGVGDSGPATAALISKPVAPMAFDASGNFYVSEANGNRVRKIDMTTRIITTIAGTGVLASGGDGGPATAAQFNTPFGVAFDLSGNLYVPEFNGNRVRRVDAAGIITTVAGTGAAGLSGDGGAASAARLNSPGGLAFDSFGNLYITDFFNARLRKVDTTGKITSIAGGGVSFGGDGGPATAALLNAPSGATLDRAGNLYIADFGNNRVRRVDAMTRVITTVVGTGTAGFNGDTDPVTGHPTATEAKINSPRDLAFGPDGNLYVGDNANNRVRKIDASGNITTVAGTGAAGFGGDGGPATAALLNGNTGIAFDFAGNLYIAEFFSNRVRKVDVTTGIITTVAGTGVGAGASGDGGLATAARINSPSNLAFDSVGNFYVSEFNGSRVRKIDTTTGIITTVAGTGVGGFNGDTDPATGHPTATDAKINTPRGVAVDSSGNLYIGDRGNGRVRKVDLSTGFISTVAGGGAPADGVGDDRPAMEALLNNPFGVTFDSSGNLYIAEAAGNRVRVVDGTPPIVTFGLPSPSANANGWNNTDVSIPFAASDTGSGVQSTTPSAGPLVLSIEGAAVSALVTATDRARNQRDFESPSVMIDKTPPQITLTASVPMLWPANAKLVADVISGFITDSLSGVDPNTATFRVIDQYGLLQPDGPVTVMPDGSYSFTAMLEATRKGQDLGGRQYQIVVTASDRAGNTMSARTVVTVPHDQRQ